MAESTDTTQNEMPISKEVVGYFKDMATKFMGTADILVECTYCHESVPAWEALCVAHLFTGGIPAHLSCPMDAFLEYVGELGLERGFPYDSFSNRVETKMEAEANSGGEVVSGTIDHVRTLNG